MNFDIIRNAAQAHGIRLPKAIIEAEKVAAAAEAHRIAVASTPEPDWSTLTATNAPVLAEQAQAYRTRAERAMFAAEVAGYAQGRVTAAWLEAVPAFLEDFRKPFDEAAKVFTEAHKELGPALVADGDAANAHGKADVRLTMLDAARTLEALTGVRDALAAHAHAILPGNHDDLPTRIATYASNAEQIRAFGRGRAERRGSLAFWVTVLDIPGTVIKWRTPTEQEADVAAYRAKVAA